MPSNEDAAGVSAGDWSGRVRCSDINGVAAARRQSLAASLVVGMAVPKKAIAAKRMLAEREPVQLGLTPCQ